MAENKFSKYLLYAIGEILLVVIGILIALQLNNQNEVRKTNIKEDVYLSSIKEDLQINIKTLEEFVLARESAIESVEILMEFYEGKREVNLNEWNFHNVDVLIWFPFIQNDNTYQELMNSGNFAIISNRSIKSELQNLQSSYAKIKFIEGEMQQDFESYLYVPYFNLADLNSTMSNYFNQLENGSDVSDKGISLSNVQTLLGNQLYKNGLVLALFNSEMLLEEYTEMIERTGQVIDLIDQESTQ